MMVAVRNHNLPSHITFVCIIPFQRSIMSMIQAKGLLKCWSIVMGCMITQIGLRVKDNDPYIFRHVHVRTYSGGSGVLNDKSYHTVCLVLFHCSIMSVI